MKKNRLLTCLLLLLGCVSLYGQDLTVKSFERLDRDLSARTNERLDLNDEPCAVIRVSIANAKSYRFDGNVVGDVVYRPGEALVYVPAGTRNITLKSERSGLLRFEFPEKIEKQVVYRMDVKLILSEDQKTRTLLMPVVSVGTPMSYGIMIGVVKKTGFYVKVKYNFKDQQTDFKCNEQGIVEGDQQQSWFTGETNESRLALTGGLLQRFGKRFYLYVGAGYGYKKIAWQMHSPDDVEQWAECTDKTQIGVEADLGGILRFKNFAISAGVQTNSFKHVEATLGMGLMF